VQDHGFVLILTDVGDFFYSYTADAEFIV